MTPFSRRCSFRSNTMYGRRNSCSLGGPKKSGQPKSYGSVHCLNGGEELGVCVLSKFHLTFLADPDFDMAPSLKSRLNTILENSQLACGNNRLVNAVNYYTNERK